MTPPVLASVDPLAFPPGPLAVYLTMGGMMLFGLLAWLSLILNPVPALTRLRQGFRWIEWRPVPGDLPRKLLLFLGLGLLGQLHLGLWASRRGYLDGALPMPMMFASLALFQGLAAWVILQQMRTYRLDAKALFGWRPVRDLSPWLYGAMAYALTLPLVSLAAVSTQGLFHWLKWPFERQPIFDQLGNSLSTGHLILLFLLIAVLAPVCEELLFRGILFPWLASRFGAGSALIFHSVIFAAIHQHAATLLPLFTLSLMLGVVYAHTRNLGVPVCLHILFNAMNLVSFFLLPRDWL